MVHAGLLVKEGTVLGDSQASTSGNRLEARVSPQPLAHLTIDLRVVTQPKVDEKRRKRYNSWLLGISPLRSPECGNSVDVGTHVRVRPGRANALSEVAVFIHRQIADEMDPTAPGGRALPSPHLQLVGKDARFP